MESWIKLLHPEPNQNQFGPWRIVQSITPPTASPSRSLCGKWAQSKCIFPSRTGILSQMILLRSLNYVVWFRGAPDCSRSSAAWGGGSLCFHTQTNRSQREIPVWCCNTQLCLPRAPIHSPRSVSSDARKHCRQVNCSLKRISFALTTSNSHRVLTGSHNNATDKISNSVCVNAALQLQKIKKPTAE